MQTEVLSVEKQTLVQGLVRLFVTFSQGGGMGGVNRL